MSRGHRHPENRSDFVALANFASSTTRPLQPLRKIRDFDLMFDTNFSDELRLIAVSERQITSVIISQNAVCGQ